MHGEDTGSSDNPVYCTRFDPDRESAATATVYAISSVKEIEPDALESNLYDTIGPDALDTIIAGESDVEVNFAFEEYEVVVDGEGEIRIYGSEE